MRLALALLLLAGCAGPQAQPSAQAGPSPVFATTWEAYEEAYPAMVACLPPPTPADARCPPRGWLLTPIPTVVGGTNLQVTFADSAVMACALPWLTRAATATTLKYGTPTPRVA